MNLNDLKFVDFEDYVINSSLAPWNSNVGYKYIPKSMDFRDIDVTEMFSKSYNTPLPTDDWFSFPTRTTDSPAFQGYRYPTYTEKNKKLREQSPQTNVSDETAQGIYTGIVAAIKRIFE